MKIIKQLMWVCVVGIMTAAVAIASDGIVAEGDGFAISQQDLSDIQAYFSERGLNTNEREYVSGALKLFLFAEEAVAKGLAAKSDAFLSGKEKVGRLYQLYRLNVNHLTENYTINEEAIESYYLAHPEKFTMSKAPFDKDNNQVYALDNEIKEAIRKKILNAKQPRLIENEFLRLKEKYHVKLL